MTGRPVTSIVNCWVLEDRLALEGRALPGFDVAGAGYRGFDEDYSALHVAVCDDGLAEAKPVRINHGRPPSQDIPSDSRFARFRGVPNTALSTVTRAATW